MKRAALLLAFALVGCKDKKSDPAPKPTTTEEGSGSASAAATDVPPDPHAGHGHGKGPHEIEQVPAPFDVKTAPADAKKTPSGLSYKMVTDGTGKTPGPNDGVKIHYTAWRPDGTTAASTQGGEPTTEFLYSSAGGFPEGLMLMKEGGKAMFWLPPEAAAAPGQEPEVLAFQIELIAVISAPPTPADVAKAPAKAKKTKSGVTWQLVKTNAGGDQARAWDKVALSYTGWSNEGGVVDSSEMKGKPLDIPVDRLPPVFAEVVPQLHAGERARLWFPASMLGQGTADMQLCFEIEIHGVTKLVEPPKAPEDVAKPPATALTTPKGVYYVVLESGTGGQKPTANDKVKVDYTGWTTDGQRFDSSIPEGKPAEFDVGGVIPGWTDTLLQMQVGDKWRVWIPEELAYKGQPQRPQGMLVFDMKLLEVIGSKVEFVPPP